MDRQLPFGLIFFLCTFIFHAIPTSGLISKINENGLIINSTDILPMTDKNDNLINESQPRSAVYSTSGTGSSALRDMIYDSDIPKMILDHILQGMKTGEENSVNNDSSNDLEEEIHELESGSNHASKAMSNNKEQITPERSTANPLNNQNGNLTHLKLKIKISLQNKHNNSLQYGTHNTDSFRSAQNNPSLLEDLWNTTIPVLVKNNNVQIHPKIDYTDMSTVLPEMPLMVKKLQEIHRPGHVTVIIMNPKNIKADRGLVKKTKICCELRHILSNNDKLKNTDHSAHLNAQKLLDKIFEHGSFEDNDDERTRASTSHETDFHFDDVNDVAVDSPWSNKERDVVSKIMNNLHLFHGPEHISAISFNPRHIETNENPKLLHLLIKIASPLHREKHSNEGKSAFENIFGSSEAEDGSESTLSDAKHSLHESSDENQLLETIFGNNDEGVHESTEHDPSQEFESHPLAVQRIQHVRPKVSVRELPLNKWIYTDHTTPKHAQKPKKLTLLYFIMHKPHGQEMENHAHETNLQSLLRTVFSSVQQLGSSTDNIFPNHLTTPKPLNSLQQFHGKEPHHEEEEEKEDSMDHLAEKWFHDEHQERHNPHLQEPLSQFFPKHRFTVNPKIKWGPLTGQHAESIRQSKQIKTNDENSIHGKVPQKDDNEDHTDNSPHKWFFDEQHQEGQSPHLQHSTSQYFPDHITSFTAGPTIEWGPLNGQHTESVRQSKHIQRPFPDFSNHRSLNELNNLFEPVNGIESSSHAAASNPPFDIFNIFRLNGLNFLPMDQVTPASISPTKFLSENELPSRLMGISFPSVPPASFSAFNEEGFPRK